MNIFKNLRERTWQEGEEIAWLRASKLVVFAEYY
jgi:hypothetical protein